MGMRQAAMKELARRELARRQQSQTPTGEPKINEQRADQISFADRAIVKNFSQSPEKSAHYLREQHPNLDIQAHNGRLLVKEKGATEYNVVDPEGFDLEDITDIAYDVGSGITEAFAFPFTGPAGSAAVGAGSETLRQGIGNLAGIDNDAGEMAKDAAMVGGMSALIPGLGRLLKPAAKGAANAAKSTVSKLTQATADDVDVFVNKGAELDKILDSPTGFTDQYNTIIKEVAEKEKAFKSEINKQFAELRKQGIEVDISTARKVYDDKLAELNDKIARGAASDSDVALRDAIGKERDQLFSQKVDGSTTQEAITGSSKPAGKQDLADGQDINDAMDLRQKLAARANFKNKSDLQKSLDSADLSESLASRGYGELGQSIDNVANEIGSSQSRQQFKDHIEFVGDIAKHFKSPESVESFLKAADKGGRKTIAEKIARIDSRFGTNLKDTNKVISTAQALKGQQSGNLLDLTRPKSAVELLGGAVGAKTAWASGQPWLIPFTLTGGAAIGKKMGSVTAARRYVDFIVDVESKALGIDKKAQELLRQKLYKSVTGESALRSAVKGAGQTTRSEE